MALNTLIVGVITCVLIGSAIAFAELHAWRGLRCYALYAGAGLIASELVAAPAMWELFALPAGWLESVAMNGRTALSRAQQSDTAITHAQAFLIASAPILGALGAITTGFVLLGWLVAGGPALVWIGVELLLFGVASFVTLGRHRRTGLEHTSAGVERHEIDARARIAMHIVDRHCEMVERLKGVRQ